MTKKSQTATVLYSTNANFLCGNLTKEYNVFRSYFSIHAPILAWQKSKALITKKVCFALSVSLGLHLNCMFSYNNEIEKKKTE